MSDMVIEDVSEVGGIAGVAEVFGREDRGCVSLGPNNQKHN
jgi:hypothetical protein